MKGCRLDLMETKNMGNIEEPSNICKNNSLGNFIQKHLRRQEKFIGSEYKEPSLPNIKSMKFENMYRQAGNHNKSLFTVKEPAKKLRGDRFQTEPEHSQLYSMN